MDSGYDSLLDVIDQRMKLNSNMPAQSAWSVYTYGLHVDNFACMLLAKIAD